MSSADQIIATFLRRAGTGPADDVRALLFAVPALVNAVGPHPFWGGRPNPKCAEVAAHLKALV